MGVYQMHMPNYLQRLINYQSLSLNSAVILIINQQSGTIVIFSILTAPGLKVTHDAFITHAITEATKVRRM